QPPSARMTLTVAFVTWGRPSIPRTTRVAKAEPRKVTGRGGVAARAGESPRTPHGAASRSRAATRRLDMAELLGGRGGAVGPDARAGRAAPASGRPCGCRCRGPTGRGPAEWEKGNPPPEERRKTESVAVQPGVAARRGETGPEMGAQRAPVR